MFPVNYKKIFIILGLFLLTEVLSYIGFASAAANPFIFAFFILAALAVTIYKLEYGILLAAAELLVSSFGYLIYMDIVGRRLSLRIALWLIVMLVFTIRFVWQLFKQKNASAYWQTLKRFAGWKWFGLLALFVAIGAINGLLRGHATATLFSDFNAWLYFLLLLPAIAVYGGASADSDSNAAQAADRQTLADLFFAAAIWLSIKTLFLLFVFTHDLSIAPTIYSWLRRTLVGEMTPTLSGWPRIFLQGQIYPALAFFIIFWLRAADWEWKKFWARRNCPVFFVVALFLSTILISFSRSFWVGLAAAMAVSLFLLWRLASFPKALAAGLWAALALISGFIIIYLVAAWPYWHRTGGDFSSEFLERATSGNEAALASRWSLLPVLSEAIAKEPFLGQGYGATVTYFSRDPRILQNNPSGAYTTYAFEWGYLDIWLKLGLLGLLSYLILLGQMLFSFYRQGIKHNDYLFFGLGAGLLFLAVINFFTPYLNHPLGIGALIAGSCLIWLNKVY
jgi:O-antigen ligase